MDEVLRKATEKMMKHYTYEFTGYLYADVKAVSGYFSPLVSAGVYYCPTEEDETKRFDVVDNNNVHFGYATLHEDGLLYDNNNRAVFEILETR